LDLHDKLVRLSIADSGIGIPEEERSKVFDRFYRVAKSRSQPGNGLGLSLVQAVVELHQGEIKLSDNEPGLIVTLELPEIDIVEGNEIKNEQAGIEVSTPA
ncbi:sensor histidine kinase KdpD, partial [Oleiphilus sp. HI0125]